MSTIKTDAIEAATGTNTDLSLDGKGSGVPDLGAGFKVGSVAGVPTASIRDDAVTLAKLAAGTDGNLITYDASGDPAHVATGTATHVLTSNGAGAAPTFQAAAGGAWTFIQSISASNVASVDFDSALSSSYKVYCLIGSSIESAAPHNPHIWIRTSTDGGSTWDSGASDYSWAVAGEEPGSTNTGNAYDHADAQIVLDGDGSLGPHGSDAASNSIFELKISNPSNATLEPMMLWTCAVWGFGAEHGAYVGAGARQSGAAIDSIQVLMATGNIWGDFKLYGIADS